MYLQSGMKNLTNQLNTIANGLTIQRVSKVRDEISIRVKKCKKIGSWYNERLYSAKKSEIINKDYTNTNELYYFDVNGRLKTNSYNNDYYLNEKGQQTVGGSITIVDVGPEIIKTYQVDNLDYYYIN